MKKNKISKNWIREQHKDIYVKKSRSIGYRSRSAFKLIELNDKFHFLKKKTFIIDLGSSPGGWSQVASEIAIQGKVISIDKKEMDKIENVDFLQGDFSDEVFQEKIKDKFSNKVDVIISDMAADTTGNKSLDCIRTNSLCIEAISFSRSILVDDGTLVSKIFMGDEFNEVRELANKIFKKVGFYKPSSSKDFSKETYIHCKGLKSL